MIDVMAIHPMPIRLRDRMNCPIAVMPCQSLPAKCRLFEFSSSATIQTILFGSQPPVLPMSSNLPEKVVEQMTKAGLPTGGSHPFRPRLVKNIRSDELIEKRAIGKGPKRGKRGYVDEQGRIWIRDRAHAHVPDHWDVQIADGDDYIRVDFDGNLIT